MLTCPMKYALYVLHLFFCFEKDISIKRSDCDDQSKEESFAQFSPKVSVILFLYKDSLSVLTYIYIL